MSLRQPSWLLLLVLVGVLLAAYVIVLDRRRRDTMRFTALSLLERIAPDRTGRLRHVPTAVLLVALVLLVVGLAGPTVEGRVPRNHATIVLAIDVSLSMKATDVTPSRLVAAQTAARSFAAELPPSINLGLVSFAGTAAVLVAPTTDRGAVDRAISTLRLSESTATGEAIFAALQSIDAFTASVPGSGEGPPPAHIVVMTDGEQTVPGGTDAENAPRGAFTAARAAAEAGVPVSTIAFGTGYGTIDLDGERRPVPIDEAAMSEIARIAGGRSFAADNVDELLRVYEELREHVGYEIRRTDASKPWIVAGTLATMVGLGSAMVLGRRIP